MTKNLNIFNSIFHKASDNRKLYVFLFCLSLSTFFWFLNALGKKFTTDVVYQVSYNHFPSNKVVLNELPKYFKIKIKGLGFDLMTYKLRIRKPSFNINLSKIDGIHQPIDSIQQNTLASSSFASYISSQLGDNIEIKEIYPDSIHFLLDIKKEKLVKIIPITKINFEKQYQLFGKIQVKPLTTTVRGPSSIIDTLEQVYTDRTFFQNLSKTVIKSVSFNKKYAQSQLEFNPSKVILYVPVEKYTETSIMVNIAYINVPDSITMKAIPNEIELKFLIPLSKMESLTSTKFRAEIDYKKINEDFNRKLKVEINEYPSFIKSLTLNPVKVEYILRKQN